MSTLRALASRVPPPPGLEPDQVVTRLTGVDTGAVMVDGWGRVHPLSTLTRVGRDATEPELGVIDASVSRRHAELSRDAGGGLWYVRDLGSTNGTFVAGHRVEAPRPITDRDVIFFGHVGFVFVRARESLTRRTPAPSLLAPAAAPRLRVLDDPPGAGVLEEGGRRAVLAPIEHAVIAVLATRAPQFITSGELAAALAPWLGSAADPKAAIQLAGRVERTLARASLELLFERHPRHGYRLRVAIAWEDEAEVGLPGAATTPVAAVRRHGA